MSGRIQTTHVGSLPRSQAVTDLVFAAERGEAVDAGGFDRVIGAVDPDIVWAKLATLSEGAALASRKLWRAAA